MDFSGFLGYDLTPGLPIEGAPYLYPDLCNETSFLEEISSKELIKKIDILGREMKNQKGFSLEIYSDGIVKKIYQIK